MLSFRKDSHLVLSVVMVMITWRAVQIEKVRAQEFSSGGFIILSSTPPENRCTLQTTCISCVSTKTTHLPRPDNNGTCIWELTSTRPRCTDQFVQKEGLLQVVYQLTGCDYAQCHDNKTCQFWDNHAFCGISTSPPAPDTNCQCEHGYVKSKDSSRSQIRCLKSSVRHGEFCEETKQCSSSTENSALVCVPGSNICDCENGIPSDDLKRCLPIAYQLASTKCEKDVQCQLGEPGNLSLCALKENGPFSKNTTKVCKCIPGVAVNRVGSNKCLPIARYIEESCEIHAQCTAGLRHSRCINNKCECIKGYKSYLINGDKWICGRQ